MCKYINIIIIIIISLSITQNMRIIYIYIYIYVADLLAVEVERGLHRVPAEGERHRLGAALEAPLEDLPAT